MLRPPGARGEPRPAGPPGEPGPPGLQGPGRGQGPPRGGGASGPARAPRPTWVGIGWAKNGNVISSDNSGGVGIGTLMPGAKLDVQADPTANVPQLRVGPIARGNSTASIPSYVDFWSSFDNYATDQGPRRTASI